MKVVETFNPKAYQIADEGQLGAVQCEYRDDTHISWGYTALLLFLGILFLSITYLLLQPSSSASTGSWFDWFYTLIHNVQSLCFILVSVLMFIGGLAGIYQRCRDFVQGEKHIYICSQGFIVARKRITEVVRWEDIEQIQQRFVYSQPGKHKKPGVLDGLPTVSYTIQIQGNTGHIFPEELGATIEQKMTAYLLPQTIAAYQAEKPLNFGWLTLTTQGIQLNTTPMEKPRRSKRSWEWYSIWKHIIIWLERKQALSGTSTTTGEQFLPWSRLTMLWIDESKSTLIICRRNERQHWAIIPLNHITNPELCLALIRHVVSNIVKGNPDAIVKSKIDTHNNQTTSLERYQVSDAYQLGALVASYQARTARSGKIFLWISIPFLLLVTGILVWVSVSLLADFNDPFFFSPPLIALTIGLSLLFLIVEFSPIFFTLYTHDTLATPMRRKICVDLHTDGIVYREGSQQQIIAWQQIKFVQRQTAKIWSKLHRFYMLQLNNHSTIILRMIIADVQELGDAIEHEVTKQQLPQMLVDYGTGKQIIFPCLCITHHYIYNSVEKLPWDQIDEIKANQEKLIIKEKSASGDWLSLPISLFPNVRVMEELLRHIKQEQGLDTQLLL